MWGHGRALGSWGQDTDEGGLGDVGHGRASGTRGQGHGWRIQGRGDMGTGTQGCPDQVLQPLLLRDVPLSLQPADVVLLLAGLGGHSVTSRVPKVSPPCPPSPLLTFSSAVRWRRCSSDPPPSSSSSSLSATNSRKLQGGAGGVDTTQSPRVLCPHVVPHPPCPCPHMSPSPQRSPTSPSAPAAPPRSSWRLLSKRGGRKDMLVGGGHTTVPPSPQPPSDLPPCSCCLLLLLLIHVFAVEKSVCVWGGVSGWAHVPPLPPK